MAEPATAGSRAYPASGALAALALATGVAYWGGDSGYQAFVDKYPVDRFSWSEVVPYGPTLATREPLLSRNFDWYIDWEPQRDRLLVMEPGSVLVYGGQLKRLRRDYRVLLETSSRERVLVIWGDELLSTMLNEEGTGWQDDILWVWTQFSRIACQAKDVQVDLVRTAPMGLGEMYLRGNVWTKATSAMKAASLLSKPRNVLATPLDVMRTLPESYKAVVASRETCVNWAQSPEAREVQVDFRTVPDSRWWGELSTYKFLLSPHGLAVQSTKTIEALLVLTVPIVQRGPAHQDLMHMGFPVLMVDAWDNITRRFLDQSWASLSPRLPSFRSNCLTAESYWMLFIGQMPLCY